MGEFIWNSICVHICCGTETEFECGTHANYIAFHKQIFALMQRRERVILVCRDKRDSRARSREIRRSKRPKRNGSKSFFRSVLSVKVRRSRILFARMRSIGNRLLGAEIESEKGQIEVAFTIGKVGIRNEMLRLEQGVGV